MNEKLYTYIRDHFKKTTDDWSFESFTLSSEETFQNTDFQQLFQDQEMSHKLYYSSIDNESLFPFEIYVDDTTVALGYMMEDEQHLLFLEHNENILIEEL